MCPVIAHLGPLTVYSYGLMLAVAAVVCAALLSRDAKVYGISREQVYDLFFWSVVGGLAGARIFYIFLNWEMFRGNPWEALMLQHGGLAWQGGLILGAVSSIIFVRRQNLPWIRMLDLCAPYIALGQSIGRVGCFLNGCCFGREAPWGIYFPVHEAHLHPTQLYSTAGLFIIFLVLKKAQRSWQDTGNVFVLYLVLSAVERFIVEFFRADHVEVWVGLSIFQIVSVLILSAGLVLFFFLRRNRRS